MTALFLKGCNIGNFFRNCHIMLFLLALHNSGDENIPDQPGIISPATGNLCRQADFSQRKVPEKLFVYQRE